MQLFRRSLALPLLAFLLAACSTDGSGPMDPDPEVDGPAEIDGVVIENTTPEGALESFAAAHNAKSIAAYRALLCEDFQFYIRDDDAGSFPWLQEDFWDRATDLSFTGNMFDPNFAGTNPPVGSCEFQYNILNQRDVLDDQDVVIGKEATIDATIQVLTGPNDGFRADTRLILRLRQRDDGFYCIYRLQEVVKLEPGRGSVEDSSWGSVKSLYR